MYELIVLSLLMRTPAHGYLIARIISDIIGPYAKMSNGRLYPLLARLEEGGLIAIDEEASREQHGERPSRSYRITEAGRKRFLALMMDTTSNPGDYQRIFHQKAAMLSRLQLSQRLFLIDHYINYCQAHILHLVAEGEDLAQSNYYQYEGAESSLPATLDVMQHLADQWRLEAAWAQRLREREQRGQAESAHATVSVNSAESEKYRVLDACENLNMSQNPHKNENTEL